MEPGDLDTLRRRVEQAYARWRACDAQRPRDQAADEECARLKHDYDRRRRGISPGPQAVGLREQARRLTGFDPG